MTENTHLMIKRVVTSQLDIHEIFYQSSTSIMNLTEQSLRLIKQNMHRKYSPGGIQRVDVQALIAKVNQRRTLIVLALVSLVDISPVSKNNFDQLNKSGQFQLQDPRVAASEPFAIWVLLRPVELQQQ